MIKQQDPSSSLSLKRSQTTEWVLLLSPPKYVTLGTMVAKMKQDAHLSDSRTTPPSSSTIPSQQPFSNKHPSIRRKDDDKRGPQWREAVAGACAGAISKTVIAPLERIKLLMQLARSPPPGESFGQTFQQQPPQQHHKSAWRLALHVYREQGLWSFWRGNLPSVMRTAGTAAIHFCCMDYYKRMAVEPVIKHLTTTTATISSSHDTAPIDDDDTEAALLERRQKFVSSLISGGMAGATSTTIMYPFEFLRTRLAMDMRKEEATRQFRGMRHVVRHILRTDGIRGIYEGYAVAVTGGIVYRVMYLGGYDALKAELVWHKQQNQDKTQLLTWGERIAVAQSVSLVAGTVSYPLDSVRRRMMMQAGIQPVSSRPYRNARHCVSVVLRCEGITGLFLGIGPNILRSAGGAILLVGYDAFRSML